MSEDRGAAVLKRVVAACEPRPESGADARIKNRYAIRFAEEVANLIARDLAPRLSGIQATARREASSVAGRKQLDVNFSTPHLGLAVGISLKSVHIREATGAQRYTHNMKRNEEELRIEATGYHKRQPYAVMIGVLWLPFDSCDDGKKGNPSSFGSWVRHLRPYAGRRTPADDADRFERIYIGLYAPDGSALGFFDVEANPPKNGKPRRLMLYDDFLDAVYREYSTRNKADFRWADGGDEPLDPDEIEPLSGDNEEERS